MADNTAIEWADSTWNPTVGCSVLSPGCSNCYAMRTAWRQHQGEKYAGLTRLANNNPVWTGTVRLHEPALDWPLRKRKPLRIFVNSMSDLFHESLPDGAIDRVFAVMALCPQHTFLVLTKRAQRMRDYMITAPQRVLEYALSRFDLRNPYVAWSTSAFGPCTTREYWRDLLWPRPNVWLGVSVEDQTRADERIPLLLDTPAATRFISAEPLLGPIDLEQWLDDARLSSDTHRYRDAPRRGLDWVIAGGESGTGARPMHPEWARKIRDDCVAAGVAFFLKQWGEWHPCESHEENGPCYPMPGHAPFDSWKAPMLDDDRAPGWHWRRIGKKAAGRMLDGREWSEFPA